jgi:hypothetical protein
MDNRINIHEAFAVACEMIGRDQVADEIIRRRQEAELAAMQEAEDNGDVVDLAQAHAASDD